MERLKEITRMNIRAEKLIRYTIAWMRGKRYKDICARTEYFRRRG